MRAVERMKETQTLTLTLVAEHVTEREGNPNLNSDPNPDPYSDCFSTPNPNDVKERESVVDLAHLEKELHAKDNLTPSVNPVAT